MLSPRYIILGSQRPEDSVDLDEAALYESLHQNLRCLQVQLVSPLVLKEVSVKFATAHQCE